MTESTRTPAADIADLHVHFPIRHGRHRLVARAVDGVDLTVNEREIVALVGESGCGKTTIARTIMRLHEATSGSISIGGVDITHLGGRKLRAMRRDFQMIFQDPFDSLPANSSAFDVVAEGLAIHRRDLDSTARRRATLEALASCGLPANVAGRRMFELSGGQRQRVAIASAVAVEPRLLVADEPVSMLDVSLRAGILRVLLDLRERLGIATLFITHDLALAGVFADRVAVLYLGRIVEQGVGAEVIANPAHPYTRALVDVMPRPDGRRTARTLLAGEPPNPTAAIAGCRFAARCPLFQALGSPERCTTEPPALRSISADHAVACHFSDTTVLSTAKENIA
ncbi:ABC transporter ATP-binding protein [Mycolicibacterium septicum]|uniref:oligopeptide/dipeptide ABC transporter ATP-binding protein n=1 Tax=Mycolicibacterium septicum TaxID=98668 RepID=UPI0023E22BE5|nr:ABC transporter ATP-binding protein [Mycolicibacterium septicum]MDF3338861.1 ABC transporter ATP-binding protein [Mycolicibacterium septicum]